MAFVCENCDMSFTHNSALLRHQLQSCKRRFDFNAGGQKRRRIDGGASSSSPTMQKCDLCDISVPREQMLAHSRTIEHKNNSCKPLSDGVQLMQSAFKNRIVTYRISGDREHTDYTAFFEDIKSKVISLIGEILRVQQTLKINMVVVGRYFLQSQELVSDKSFNTSNAVVTMANDLHDVYQSFVEVMKVQSTDFQEKDSGVVKQKSLVFYSFDDIFF